MAHWKLLLGRLFRKIWFRIALFCLGGIAAAFAAVGLQPHIPADIAIQIGADSVGNLLGIMAASMLTVTTFSLSTLVSAYGSASTNVTPRATQLVIEDSTAQNALATFLGAFLYSIVGIVALSTGAYGANGRLVLLAVTIVVILLVVLTFLRWIARLTGMGTVRETIDRLERATTHSLRRWVRHPHLRAAPREDWIHMARPVYPDRIGYVQNVDVEQLSAIVGDRDTFIDVDVLPGALVDPARPLAFVGDDLDEEDIARVRRAFLIGTHRTYEQDPRFGLIALGEVASRALSPAINDAGTAMEVIGAGMRVIAICREGRDEDDRIAFPKVRMPTLSVDELFEDFFTPIARDGAGVPEIGVRLQRVLHALARLSPDLFGPAAAKHSAWALRRALRSLDDEDDREHVRRAALMAQSEEGQPADSPSA